MEKKNFISTRDSETANKLIACGFQLIQKSDGLYVFINDTNKTVFSGADISFTNKLFL